MDGQTSIRYKDWRYYYQDDVNLQFSPGFRERGKEGGDETAKQTLALKSEHTFSCVRSYQGRGESYPITDRSKQR